MTQQVHSSTKPCDLHFGPDIFCTHCIFCECDNKTGTVWILNELIKEGSWISLRFNCLQWRFPLFPPKSHQADNRCWTLWLLRNLLDKYCNPPVSLDGVCVSACECVTVNLRAQDHRELIPLVSAIWLFTYAQEHTFLILQSPRLFKHCLSFSTPRKKNTCTSVKICLEKLLQVRVHYTIYQMRFVILDIFTGAVRMASLSYPGRISTI